MHKWSFHAVVLACLLVGSIPFSAAAADTAFPKIDSQAFCAELVGKMLNPAEKLVEGMRCMNQEVQAENQTRPFWKFLDEKHRKLCLHFFTEPRFTSYDSLQGCMFGIIGMKCMNGELTCKSKE